MHDERHLDRRAAWAVLAPAVALLLAGCGDDKTGTTASRTSTSPAAKVATSAPPSASPSASVSVSPAALKAADGTRLKACADARCEVEIKAGDTIRFDSRGMGRSGIGAMKVKSVQTSKVVYDLSSAEFTQPGPKRTTANINGMSLTLVSVAGEHAVIRLGGPKRGALSVTVGSGGMQVTTPGN